MAFPRPKDNSGVVIGSHGALVVDAGMNPAMAHRIQRAVRRLTDRPILWLANTVYRGDHTFGNAAFPATTKIVASRQTAATLTDLDAEKRARTQNLYGNLYAIADVTSWRRPDVVFDDHTEVDLGGRTVQLWHFGPGNSPGDTVAWVPEARAACAGNLLGHRRVPPCSWRSAPSPPWTPWAASRAPWTSRRSCPGNRTRVELPAGGCASGSEGAVPGVRLVDPPLEPRRNQRDHHRHQVDAALVAHDVHVVAVVNKA
jgi:glyoxylase-like metal-dependent hydrolase (beta-lactamase superfamily II)